ncbi:general transcription factor IIF subunit 2-like [Panonychus citri]|uniref:general transcription factor IIF subunit 2-like n=1 Tax=Panonychus citri TaxID=50023 RepID=UPI002307C78A|nr:general transcription factor IIF subunit 2-like [Panonychus citri]
MNPNSTGDMDIINASRGVWLVKVPKYMANEWETAPARSELGRLKISKGNTGRPEILFDLSGEVFEQANSHRAASDPKIPKEHRFIISDISHQHLAVFSCPKEDKSGTSSKLVLEGNVVQKGECRPKADTNYMRLKAKQMEIARRPNKMVLKLDQTPISYLPVNTRRIEVDADSKRKGDNKKSRDEKDKVLDMLFKAFEKHQYYTSKDLEKITKQPSTYLKTILKEICVYNTKNPHKNKWELKPEYRHYDEEKGTKK